MQIKPSMIATKREEKIQFIGFKFEAAELRALPIPETDGKAVVLEFVGATVEDEGVDAVAASLPALIDGRVSPSFANDCKLAKSVSKRLTVLSYKIVKETHSVSLYIRPHLTIKPSGTVCRVTTEVTTLRLTCKCWNSVRIARCQIRHGVIPLTF